VLSWIALIAAILATLLFLVLIDKVFEIGAVCATALNGLIFLTWREYIGEAGFRYANYLLYLAK